MIAAPGGGAPSHTTSASVSAPTGFPACNSRAASSTRSRPRGTSTCISPSWASNGPKIASHILSPDRTFPLPIVALSPVPRTLNRTSTRFLEARSRTIPAQCMSAAQYAERVHSIPFLSASENDGVAEHWWCRGIAGGPRRRTQPSEA